MNSIDKRFIKKFNQTLEHNGVSVVCVESMTAGLLASTICSANGALSVLKGSIVAYDSDMKTHILKIPSAFIDKYTAESKQVTARMCKSIREIYPHARLYVAMTGIAEETPEQDNKAGQIYVAIWYDKEEFQYSTVLPDPGKKDRRNAYRAQAVKFIMDKILYIVTLPPVAGIVAPET